MEIPLQEDSFKEHNSLGEKSGINLIGEAFKEISHRSPFEPYPAYSIYRVWKGGEIPLQEDSFKEHNFSRKYLVGVHPAGRRTLLEISHRSLAYSIYRD